MPILFSSNERLPYFKKDMVYLIILLFLGFSLEFFSANYIVDICHQIPTKRVEKNTISSTPLLKKFKDMVQL